jgi:hypothetical protein
MTGTIMTTGTIAGKPFRERCTDAMSGAVAFGWPLLCLWPPIWSALRHRFPFLRCLTTAVASSRQRRFVLRLFFRSEVSRKVSTGLRALDIGAPDRRSHFLVHGDTRPSVMGSKMGWRNWQPNYQSETWGVAETESAFPQSDAVRCRLLPSVNSVVSRLLPSDGVCCRRRRICT